MRKDTRIAFNRMCQRFAKGYGVADVSKQFAIEPSIAQQLRDKIVEQSTFLGKINHLTTLEMIGENILGLASQPVTSRTDTSSGGERKPKQVLGMESYKYQLYQTNADICMRYNTIDSWAKFPDLGERYSQYVLERMANDKELIGWHGLKADATTDLASYPLMQDVNRGWMQYMRENKPENILADGSSPGEIKIGPGGDYLSLDLLILDMIEQIPLYMRKGLVALVGNGIVAGQKAMLMEQVTLKPTEKALYDMAMANQGGLSWETPSNFPDRGVVVTSYDNLSIYEQEGSRRRKIQDKPERDQVEDYNSVNEGYVVEEPQKFVAVEWDSIKLYKGTDANGNAIWG